MQEEKEIAPIELPQKKALFEEIVLSKSLDAKSKPGNAKQSVVEAISKVQEEKAIAPVELPANVALFG